MILDIFFWKERCHALLVSCSLKYLYIGLGDIVSYPSLCKNEYTKEYWALLIYEFEHEITLLLINID